MERVVSEYPGVADVPSSASPTTGGRGGEGDGGGRPGATVDEAGLIDHCLSALAGYSAKSVDLVDTLPRNPTGKVLRRELRAPYWAGRERLV